MAISLLSIGNFTHASTNNDSGDDILTATEPTEPPTPTDYDLPQDKVIPIEEPFLPDPYTTGQITAGTLLKNSKGTKDIVPPFPNQSKTQASQPDQSSLRMSQPAQTPASSHTQLKVLPNTGGDTQTSTFAIFSILLLGSALVVYRPVTSLFKSNQ